MMTLFSIPKPFIGQIALIQTNAIKSWIKQIPEAEIILFGNEFGVAAICEELDITHLPDLPLSPLGTPYLHSAFISAEQHSSSEIMGFVNSDIIFVKSPIRPLQNIASRNQRFLAIGERMDLDVSSNWSEELLREAPKNWVNHGEMGLDYFFYRRKLFQSMPPFLVGRPGYDHWMIGHALQQSATLVDMSHDFKVIHQNHERSYASLGKPAAEAQPMYQEGIEADHNRSYLNLTNHLPENLHSADFLLKNESLVKPPLARILRRKWKHLCTRYPAFHSFERLMRFPVLRSLSFVFPVLPPYSAAIPKRALKSLCDRYDIAFEELTAWHGMLSRNLIFYQSFRFRYRERHTTFRKLPLSLKRAIYIYEDATSIKNRVKNIFNLSMDKTPLDLLKSLRSFVERSLYHVEVPRREYLPPDRVLGKNEIAAISCHFNPNQYKTRTQNYLEFYRKIKENTPQIRLLTVELAFGDAPFELSHLPDVIQLRTRDIMWQKERLIHLGVETLIREGYQKIAWLDGDILLEDPYWPERACQLLDEQSIIQLFSESVRLEKNQTPYVRTGVVKHFLQTGKVQLRGYSCGYAWAASSKLLSRVPLYDAAILGGGDAAIWLGSLCAGDIKKWEKSVRKIKLIQSWSQGVWTHYFPWARRFGSEVGLKIGYLEQAVSSMHHGNPKNRFYGERYRWIPEFDPTKDLKLDSSGCWAWRSNQIGLQARVKEYFKRRREDE